MKYWIVILMVIGSLRIEGQSSLDSIPSKKSSWTLLPIVYRAPETGFAFGIGGLHSFYLGQNSPVSAIQTGGVYTQRDQILLYFNMNAFPKNTNYRYNIELGYYRYVYDFFGIGNDDIGPRETYGLDFPRVRISGFRAFFPDFYLGWRYGFDLDKITFIQEDGLLDTGNFRGSNGGTTSRTGPAVQVDKRDNVAYTKSGWFLESYLQIQRSWMGSSFSSLDGLVDGRYFYEIDQSTIATQVLYKWSDGNLPFYDLPNIGGAKGTRGYLETKYRDKFSIEFNSEFRFPIYKRFRGTVFAGSGMVYSKPKELNFSSFHSAAGLGLRFQVSKKSPFNLRLDWAYGADGSAIYFTFGEAF